MIHIPCDLLSRWWLPTILSILIGATACQQAKQQAQEKVTLSKYNHKTPVPNTNHYQGEFNHGFLFNEVQLYA